MFWYIAASLYAILGVMWGICGFITETECIVEMNTTFCIALLCGIIAKLGE